MYKDNKKVSKSKFFTLAKKIQKQKINRLKFLRNSKLLFSIFIAFLSSQTRETNKPHQIHIQKKTKIETTTNQKKKGIIKRMDNKKKIIREKKKSYRRSLSSLILK
ncbi:hypothetical protein V6Z11_A05G091200 [Gossypium hirsutum]